MTSGARHELRRTHFDHREPLAWWAWRPTGPVRGVLWIIHGLHEHGGWYEEFAVRAAERGMEVRAIDMTGHGRTGGRRWPTEGFETYVRDVRSLIQALRGRSRGGRPTDGRPTPEAILGHSLGALVALRVAREPGTLGTDWSGVVLSAPALDPSIGPRWARPLSGIAARIAPWLPVARIPPEHLSADPAAARMRERDGSMRRGPVLAGEADAVLTGARSAWRSARNIRVPSLVIQGDADGITDPSASRRLAAAIVARDRGLMWLTEVRHEPLLAPEPERDRVHRAILDWLAVRLDAE